MKKLAYLECPTGIAGDMCLGALIHAGVPLDYLQEQLALLKLSEEYHLRVELVHRNGQLATKVTVDIVTDRTIPPFEAGVDPYPTFEYHSNPTNPPANLHPHEHHGDTHSSDRPPSHLPSPSGGAHPHYTRHLPEIEQLIQSARLPQRAHAWSLAVFRQLAAAEGAVHGIAPEEVHFHEVGATDAIVDIVGTCLGLDWLGIDELHCSPLPTGGGSIRVAHGQLPVPAPAVLKLWEMRQVPIYSNGIQRELVTPTGAAIATTLASHFGHPPAMTLLKVGLGAGSRHLPIPNILRLWIGTQESETDVKGSKSIGSHPQPLQNPESKIQNPSPDMPPASEAIAVLQTQIDDLNPQAIGYGFEALFAAGALDVFTQAIGMKKSRPGFLLTVICHLEQIGACEAVLFRETTTLGIRRSIQQRTLLQREWQPVQTDYGMVRLKVARHSQQGAVVNVQPEYEDCAAIARELQLPWREVHRLALQTWFQQQVANPVKGAEESL